MRSQRAYSIYADHIREAAVSAFGQEVLNSLGAFMTVCKIERNGVDERIRAAIGQD
jgi:hypothetical protein